MRVTKKIFLVLILAIFIVLPGWLDRSSPSQAAGLQSSHFVRILAGDIPGLSGLRLNAVLSLDYGSFIWLELSQADFDKLSRSTVPYIEDTQAGQIQVMGLRFDPQVDGEPFLPGSLRSEGTRPGFRLVQFLGPIKDEWLTEVESTGAAVLQYYPNNAYLVWADPEQTLQLASLKVVRWSGLFHTAYKLNAGLVERSGTISNIDVMFYNNGDISATLEALTRLGAKIIQAYPSQVDKKFYDAILQVDASQLDTIAALDTVLWLGYSSPIPGLDDEMSSQILAGNYSPSEIPTTGYNSWLSANGINGSEVTWAIIDTGVDYDHPDLGSHIVGGYNFPGACSYPGQPGSDCPPIYGGGHGTHVAGIVAANAAGGFTDPGGFLYGLGVAPSTGIFAMNSLSSTTWPPVGGWQEHSQQAILGNAVGGNNSWTTGEGTNHGYQASERTHDLMVRDGNFDTTTIAEPFIEVFSAGNSGPGSNTLTPPKEAKNLIVVASSQNYRIGDINAISSFSSRGPSVDGRYVPTITTPGEGIASTRNDVGGDCSTPIAGTNNLYAYCSGTSMASPHASGAVVLMTQWWRTFNSGANPSPAMAKALLVNGAVDMGTADIPNFAEGWGRVNLSNVIQHSVGMVYRDQQTTFYNTGETWTLSLGVPDPTRPIKVTLAWTDAAGAVGANPALVNNLDLVVLNGGNTYRGNQFNAGWSIPGGTADSLNNLENVYLQYPGSSVTVTVQAANIAGDGIPYNGDLTDQDFALVCYNCALYPDFTLKAAPASQSICAPATAIYTATVGSLLGYTTPVTLNTTGQPAGTTINFNNNPVIPPGQSLLAVGNTGAVDAGHYNLVITGTAGVTATHQSNVELYLFNAAPGQPVPVSPANGVSNQPVRPLFTWMQGDQSSAYDIQIATDPDFNNIVLSATNLVEPTFTPGIDLSSNTPYYWRVIPLNACGVGSFSSVFNFVTAAAPGDCSVGTKPSQLFNDNFESGAAGWTHTGIEDTWAFSSQRTHSGLNAFKAVDPVSSSDQLLVSPPVNLPTGQLPLTLKFWNYQSIESHLSVACWDGGILEVSTDGGYSWSQVLNQQLLTDPYNGLISTISNPLNGLNAWCGDPQDWLNSMVDISAYAGHTAQFRFRLGSDSSVSKEGWYIDDLVVQSCVNTSSPSVSISAYQAKIGLIGTQVEYLFTITNTGIYTDTFQLAASGIWPVTLSTPTTGPLGPGKSLQISLTVSVPSDAPDGTWETITLTATSTLSASATAHARAITTARWKYMYMPLIAR